MGPLVSTATVTAIGNGAAFRKGRKFAAWPGLVPRQHSTGGKTKLYGISKRGNIYLRRMFAPSCAASQGASPLRSGAPTRSKSNDSRDANRRGVGNSVGEEIALLETNTHAGRTMKTPDR